MTTPTRQFSPDATVTTFDAVSCNNCGQSLFRPAAMPDLCWRNAVSEFAKKHAASCSSAIPTPSIASKRT